ncbi:unnamed protein product, partial [Sphagnum tenellum]
SGKFSSPLSRKLAVQSKRLSALPFGAVIDFLSSSDWQQGNWVEGRKELLTVTWQGLQEGIADLRQHGILQTAKQGFQDARHRIQGLDATQLVTDFRSSPLCIQGARLWQNSDLWIKWPIVIFIPFYVLVMISFGPAVSQDLAPLWILGPLGTGFVIWQCCQAVHAMHVLKEKTAHSRELLKLTSSELYRDAQSGKLPERTRLFIDSKLQELKSAAISRRSAGVLYLRSGQAATDSKEVLVIKSTELWEYSVDKYADVTEWWRPKGRTLGRFLKKIF